MDENNFTYSDVDKGMHVDVSGNVKIIYDVDVIIQSLKMIIGAFSGEYVRSPIGSRIVQYVGRNMSYSVAEDIRDEIVSMISEFEPRVEIMGVLTEPNYDLNRYEIQINLRVRSLGENISYRTNIRSL